MEAPIVVSIYCLAYNHEKYIRKTLNGFLNQETDFRYEIIVHDDASTDGTTAIIQEYEKKHANIVAIYQTENQYSKRINIVKSFVEPYVRGKYVAMCEGDDFWIDPHKLQKQVTALEAHRDSFFCVHKVIEIYETGEKTGRFLPPNSYTTKEYSSRDFLELFKDGGFLHLSSYMVNAERWKKYIDDPPEFAKSSHVGDLPLVLFFAQLGNCLYINDCMSCYRRGVSSSWTNASSNKMASLVQSNDKFCKIYSSYDKYTNYKYHDICVHLMAGFVSTALLLTNRSYELFKKEYTEYLKHISAKKKLFMFFAAIFPHLAGNIYWKHHIHQMRKLGYHGQ